MIFFQKWQFFDCAPILEKQPNYCTVITTAIFLMDAPHFSFLSGDGKNTALYGDHYTYISLLVLLTPLGQNFPKSLNENWENGSKMCPS